MTHLMKRWVAGQVVLWFGRVMCSFLRVRPVTTFTVVLFIALARVSRLLAFFLPLKVILLAGSEGVPRYFRFFIEPADKEHWIIILSLLAIVFYVGTLLQEWVAARLSDTAGTEVMRGATEFALLKDQEVEAREYYARFSAVAADLLFSSVGLIVGLMIRPSVFFVLLMMIIAQLVITLAILNGRRGRVTERFRHLIERSLRDYVKALSGVNFLVAFLLILLPFLNDSQSNVLFAILSILIVRQSLKTVGGSVVGMYSLSRKRHRIDALVFPRVPLLPTERAEKLELRHHFGKSARQKRVAKELKAIANTEEIVARWADSSIRGVPLLLIVVEDIDGRRRELQQQIYGRGFIRHLKNEQLLFRYMKRASLMAPPVVARFDEGPFKCQICEAGEILYESGEAWHEGELELLRFYWGRRPPPGLVKAFASARPLLYRRLNAELVARLEVAVDDELEAVELKTFQQSLPWLIGRIKRLPLYVHNPDLKRNSVVRAANGDVYVMMWGRWQLEPIGIGFSQQPSRTLVEAMLAAVRSERRDVPADVTAHDLLLVSGCRRLELDINQGRYKRALERLSGLNRLIRRIKGTQTTGNGQSLGAELIG